MDYHLDLFCINEATVSAAFMQWWPAFEAIKVQAFELLSERDANGLPALDKLGATDIMHRQRDTPLKISQHFDRLMTIIGEQRTKREDLLAIKREMANVDTVGVCDNCGETGWTNVPHGKCLKNEDGVWTWKPHHYGKQGNPIYYEMVVSCSCPKGYKIQAKYTTPPADPEKAGKRKKKESVPSTPPMSLERFEQTFTPDWRRLMREVEEAKKKINKVRMENDYSPNDLISDLAKKTNMPPKPQPPKKGRKSERHPPREEAVHGTDEGETGRVEEGQRGRGSRSKERRGDQA